MRKVTFGVANSLDNYIARKDGSVDWLLWGDEVAAFMKDYWKTIDTVVMGRKTYEAALQHGGGGNPYKKIKTYVCSRTWEGGQDESVEIIREDAAGFVRELKQKKGKDICVLGGGELAKSLLEANVVDEIGVSIHPVLLGEGVPLFYEMRHQIDLELLDCQRFSNGCVLITYRVKS